LGDWVWNDKSSGSTIGASLEEFLYYSPRKIVIMASIEEREEELASILLDMASLVDDIVSSSYTIADLRSRAQRIVSSLMNSKKYKRKGILMRISKILTWSNSVSKVRSLSRLSNALFQIQAEFLAGGEESEES